MPQARVCRGFWFSLLASVVLCRPHLSLFRARIENLCHDSNAESSMTETMPRGGGGIQVESTEPSMSERTRQRYIFSFLSAFRVLHRKSMIAKQEVSDESMRRISETSPSNTDARGTGSLSDVCTEIGIEENEEEEQEEEVVEGEFLWSDSRVDVAPEPARQKAHGRRDKERSSVASCSALSVTQVEMNSNGVLCRREEDVIVKMKGIAEPNGVNTTSGGGDDETPLVNNHTTLRNESSFISSGYWGFVDGVLSLGLSTAFSNLRISRQLRPVRKAAARMTGLHGLVSQKRDVQIDGWNKSTNQTFAGEAATYDRFPVLKNCTESAIVEKVVPDKLRRGERIRRLTRLPVFSRRKKVTSNGALLEEKHRIGNNFSDNRTRRTNETEQMSLVRDEIRRRTERVTEIDRIIGRVQKEVVELQCEKDDLQERPNPLYNYSSISQSSSDEIRNINSESAACLMNRTSRMFNFPPPDLANDYIEDLVDSGRLSMLNHTHLWKSKSKLFEDNEAEEYLTDDDVTLEGDFGPRSSGEASATEKRNRGNRAASGSWLLRQSLGRGLSLGEKIGETIELAAYKAVCSSVMSILARSVSALHGVNVMTHSDIRLYVETGPDLPPLGKGALSDTDKYAEEAIRKAIRRNAKKRKRRSKHQGQNLRCYSNESDEGFLQRDAVIETLISHCQISAPLLKLFPLSWQRALLGNIITLVAALISDFVDGIQIQILGHQLSVSFKPITEFDMMNQINPNSRRHRARTDEFEAAVQATAQDVSKSLEFLDKWHERALGSGMLRTQIGSMVARVVLTLVDDVLAACKFDLWSAQVGGCRAFLELEPRNDYFLGEGHGRN